MSDSIKEFYKNSHIFITGGSGFVGIAIIEKFLRNVPFNKMYLLLRPKKGVSSEDRLKDIFKSKIIKQLELNEDEVLKKFVVIPGDINAEKLGISDSDRDLLGKQINVVIHCAASLDFGANFKETTVTNLVGTRQVLELCKSMKALKCMVQVSSAYVNADKNVAEEIVYPSPGDPEKLIEMCNTLRAEELENQTSAVLGTHVNMYTLTKSLAEHEVTKSYKNFPTVIVRPSMIVGAWREPVPGWTISKNGPQGFFMGATNGVVRRLPVDQEIVYDYIPVDIVVNEILVAAWYVHSKKPSESPVFHVTSSTCNPFRWKCLLNKMSSVLHDYPCSAAIWYPTLKLLPSMTLFKISALIFHFLPAVFFDLFLRLSGKRPRVVRLHVAINKSLNLLAPFIFNEWKFHNTKTLELDKEIPESERDVFYINLEKLDWEHFFLNLAQGVRRYLLHEDDKTLNRARKKDRVLMFMNFGMEGLTFLFLAWVISLFLGSFVQSAVYAAPLFYILMRIL